MTAGTVTRSALEELHERVRAQVADPRAGIYGPGSVMWRISREGALFLGGGRAVLLQLAHPFVAHAIEQHSHLKQDPLGRFQRTFTNVFSMIFGDLETALRHSRGVHGVHTRVHGPIGEDVGRFTAGARYHANDPDALLWVHATLLDSAVQVYELVVQPLTHAEKERAYQESKRFAWLFGIPDTVLPTGWTQFRTYFDDMLASDVIRVGAAARELSSYLFAAGPRARRPLTLVSKVVTAGLLPARLRADFGFAFGPAERALFATTFAGVRRARPFLPARLRYLPAYVNALRRLEDKPPDRAGKIIEDLVGRVLTAR